MPRSHQCFRRDLAMNLLGIMLRNSCWPTTFHNIIAGDADGWCQSWPVWSIPQFEGEMFRHTRLKSLILPSPTGYMLRSFNEFFAKWDVYSLNSLKNGQSFSRTPELQPVISQTQLFPSVSSDRFSALPRSSIVSNVHESFLKIWPDPKCHGPYCLLVSSLEQQFLSAKNKISPRFGCSRGRSAHITWWLRKE